MEDMHAKRLCLGDLVDFGDDGYASARCERRGECALYYRNSGDGGFPSASSLFVPSGEDRDGAGCKMFEPCQG